MRSPGPPVDERHAQREGAHADSQRAHPDQRSLEWGQEQAQIPDDQDDRAGHDHDERVGHARGELRDHQGREHAPCGVEGDHDAAQGRAAPGIGENRRHPGDDSVVGQRHHREQDHETPGGGRSADPEPRAAHRCGCGSVMIGGQPDRQDEPDQSGDSNRACPDPHGEPPRRRFGHGNRDERGDELTRLHQDQIERGGQRQPVGEPGLHQRDDHDVRGSDPRQRQHRGEHQHERRR